MITTNRNKLVGGHTTSSVKKAVKAEADKQKITVSLYVHNLLFRETKAAGHDVKDAE